jgi:hypothetical protein
VPRHPSYLLKLQKASIFYISLSLSLSHSISLSLPLSLSSSFSLSPSLFLTLSPSFSLFLFLTLSLSLPLSPFLYLSLSLTDWLTDWPGSALYIFSQSVSMLDYYIIIIHFVLMKPSESWVNYGRTTLSIMALTIKGVFVSLNKTTLNLIILNIECHYAKCRDLFIVMLNVIMLIFVVHSSVCWIWFWWVSWRH